MISMIAAMDGKRGIGKDNKLLWTIPEDLRRFREITRGHPVVMGRKTFESLGGPLAERTNIVITHNPSSPLYLCILCPSLEEALRKAQGKPGADEVFIIGGGQIYAQALPLVDKLYLTIIEGDFGADTFFPEYSEIFKKVVFEKEGIFGVYKYKFLDLQR